MGLVQPGQQFFVQLLFRAEDDMRRPAAGMNLGFGRGPPGFFT